MIKIRPEIRAIVEKHPGNPKAALEEIEASGIGVDVTEFWVCVTNILRERRERSLRHSRKVDRGCTYGLIGAVIALIATIVGLFVLNELR